MAVTNEKDRISLEHCFQKSRCPSAIQISAPEIFVSKDALLWISCGGSVQVHKTFKIIAEWKCRCTECVDGRAKLLLERRGQMLVEICSDESDWRSIWKQFCQKRVKLVRLTCPIKENARHCFMNLETCELQSAKIRI